MNPPKIHRWASRLQLIATLFIIGAAINSAFFPAHILYTYIAVPIAMLLSIVAYLLHKRQLKVVVDYQERANRERQNIQARLTSINRGVEQERNRQ
jgi:hypothetical protein